MRRWLRYRKYKRRRSRLQYVIDTCGRDVALNYGYRRGWILGHDNRKIWLSDDAPEGDSLEAT